MLAINEELQSTSGVSYQLNCARIKWKNCDVGICFVSDCVAYILLSSFIVFHFFLFFTKVTCIWHRFEILRRNNNVYIIACKKSHENEISILLPLLPNPSPRLHIFFLQISKPIMNLEYYCAMV